MESAAQNSQEGSVPGADPRTFVLGGLAFDVHPAPRLDWQLDEEHRLFGAPGDAAPVFGQVHCAVDGASELRGDYGREIRWGWDGDVAQVATGGVRAEVRDLGDGRFVATALVAGDTRGCSALATALTGALAHRVGGLVLHASAIELDGEAILFIGPSGAGKTTAANHCRDARWLARDRAVVYPTPAGWYAAAMCGGDPIDLPRSMVPALPLRGVLRVRRGVERPEVAGLDAGSAALVLRESLQTARQQPGDEQRTLDALLALATEVRVAAIYSTLELDLSPSLREWASS